jgi:hypothetical protein
VGGYAPEAAAVMDEHFDKYFEYIRSQHGADVLTCCVFFCLGHHDSFRGRSVNVVLMAVGVIE